MHDSQTTLVLAAMLFLALPAMVWLVLLKVPGRHAAAMWCLGSALAGLGLVLMGLRPWLPQWLSYNVANTCLLASFLGWIQSLRITLERPLSWRLWWLLLIACAAFYSLLLGWASPGERGLGMRVLLSVQSVYTAYCAWRLSRRTAGANALTIALAYLLLGMGLTVHALWPGGAAVTPNPFSKSWDASVVALIALVTAMIGHFAYVGMMLDIANREQQQGQAAEQAALQTRSLDMHLQDLDRKRHMLTVAGSLAHELSQPLTMALMNIELAQLLWSTQPKAGSMLDTLLGKVQSGVDRTALILERVRRGEQMSSPRFEALNLNEVLAQSLTMIEPDLLRSDVRLSCHCAADAVPCRGDALALSQVLVNLMRNAIQAMDGMAVRQLEVRCCVQQGQAVVEVCDSGPGLSQEMLQHWGEPFISTQDSGLGLGLAISLDIMAQHAGSLTLCNRGEGGVRATISMPTASGEAS